MFPRDCVAHRVLLASPMHLSPAPVLDSIDLLASQSSLTLPIHGRAALLTCMHGSLDCGALVGRSGPQTQLIRNAGARVNDDALRSLLLAHELFGAQTWFIVQHQDCGLTLLDDAVTENLWPSLSRASTGQPLTRSDRVGSTHAAALGQLRLAARSEILAADLRQLRGHRLRPSAVHVRGYLLDVAARSLLEIDPE